MDDCYWRDGAVKGLWEGAGRRGREKDREGNKGGDDNDIYMLILANAAQFHITPNCYPTLLKLSR